MLQGTPKRLETHKIQVMLMASRDISLHFARIWMQTFTHLGTGPRRKLRRLRRVSIVVSVQDMLLRVHMGRILVKQGRSLTASACASCHIGSPRTLPIRKEGVVCVGLRTVVRPWLILGERPKSSGTSSQRRRLSWSASTNRVLAVECRPRVHIVLG